MAAISENQFYDAALAYQRTAALIAALKLDIFSLIGADGANVSLLASAANASPRGIRILCDFLVVTGLLTKCDDRYELSEQSRWFLDCNSPRSIGTSIDFLAAPEMFDLLLSDPEAYVRNGGSDGLANVAPDAAIWVRFARSMSPFASVAARSVAAHLAGLQLKPRAILDVAAGHGQYGIILAQSVKDAEVTAVDWGPVVAVAQENANSAELGDRYRTIAGSAFEADWGDGYDLAILSHILHHFSEAECVTLLRRVRTSLATGGRVFVVDFVPNEDRVSPPDAAAFAFWMLATTPAGDAYTFQDYRRMARAAGFGKATIHQLRATPSRLIVLHPSPAPADNWH